MKKYLVILTVIFLVAASFWIGTKNGRYLSSIERENLYPYKLRDIWVNNQPTCDDYYSLVKKEKMIIVDTIKNNKNQIYIKIVSLPSANAEGKLFYSILNRDQEQYIDELWLDCK